MCLVLNQEGLITKVVSNDYAGMNFFPHAKEGQTLNDVFGVNTFDNFSEAISKTLNTGLTHQQTIAHTTNDGVRWLDTFITNLRGNLDLSRQVIWTAFDDSCAVFVVVTSSTCTSRLRLNPRIGIDVTPCRLQGPKAQNRPKGLKKGVWGPQNGSFWTHFWPKSGQKMAQKGGPLLRRVPARSNVHSVHFGQKGLKKGVHF